jgi:hypothetical protein
MCAIYDLPCQGPDSLILNFFAEFFAGFCQAVKNKLKYLSTPERLNTPLFNNNSVYEVLKFLDNVKSFLSAKKSLIFIIGRLLYTVQ